MFLPPAGSDLGTEGLAGMDRPAPRVCAEGCEAARELRLAGAGEPQDPEVQGCGCPRAEPTHGCRLAFARALGLFRGQRPRVQAREGQAASLGALPNAFTTHCVPSLCWPSVTRAPASPSTPPSLAAAPWGHLAGSQDRRQSQARALRSGSVASPGKPHSYPWLYTCPSLRLLFARLVPSCRWPQLHRDTLPAPFRALITAPVFFLSWNFAP